MKIDNKKLTRLDKKSVVHTIKVDLHTLESLGLYQIPEREPDPIKVTKKLLEYLEEQPSVNRNTIKVDYERMEELGLYTRPTNYRTYLKELPSVVHKYQKGLATAACFIFIIGMSVLFVRPRLNTDGKIAKEEDITTEMITVTYLSDGADSLSTLQTVAKSIPDKTDSVSSDANDRTEENVDSAPIMNTDDVEVKEDMKSPIVEEASVPPASPSDAEENVVSSISPSNDISDAEEAPAEQSVEEEKPAEESVEEKSTEEKPVEEEKSDSETERSSLVMANVETSLNVRTKPSEDADKAGIMFQNTGGTILEQTDGWTKLESGDLVGWAKDDYLAFDDDALKLADEVGTLVATVKAENLNVRSSAGIDAPILGSVKEGAVLTVTDNSDEEWAKVEYDNNSDAYVSTEWVDMEFEVETGKTIEAMKETKTESKEEARSATVTSVTQDELNMMAAIIYCEAGNQPWEGKVAVGTVVMNRLSSGSFPNSIEAVIRAPGQFSPVAEGKFDRVYGAGNWSDSCYQAAVEAANGAKGNIGDALYFKNPARSGAHPGITIGDHVFW